MRVSLVVVGVVTLIGTTSPRAAAQPIIAPEEAEQPVTAEEIETLLAAHEFAYTHLDGVALIASIRSGITAVYEAYCAARFLIPERDGYSALPLALGIGCLAATATLVVITANRIAELNHPEDHLAAIRALGSGDEISRTEFARFEADLEDAAAASMRRWWLSMIFGVLEVAASGVLIGLTVDGRIDGGAGASIATGTGVVGLLSLSALFITPPAEAAWQAYRAHRVVGSTSAFRSTPLLTPIEGGLQLGFQGRF
ncbi:MAG: hypothetical protein AAGF12_11275 [Myxococcota bacterium]